MKAALRFEPQGLWADSVTSHAPRAAQAYLSSLGWETRAIAVSERSVQDQVWWKRWVLLARPPGQGSLPEVACPLLDEEPCTPLLHTYHTEWLLEDKKVPAACWSPAELRLDSTMPYLGSAIPKPAGAVKGGRRRIPVWDPRRPLPQLHLGSWEPQNADCLLLVGTGPSGPAARALTPGEAFKLLGGRKELLLPDAKQAEVLEELLFGTPRGLALVAGKWASALKRQSAAVSGQREEDETCTRSVLGEHAKVGICALPWEEHAQAVLMAWLEERGWGSDRTRAGGPPTPRGNAKGQQKGKDDAATRLSKRISKCLRHEAGTKEVPIDEYGWVPMPGLLFYLNHVRRGKNSHLSVSEADVRAAVDVNGKQRFLLREDPDTGVPHVAVWSGHTIRGVVGPAVEAPPGEVPAHITGTFGPFAMMACKRTGEISTCKTLGRLPRSGEPTCRLLSRWIPSWLARPAVVSALPATASGCAEGRSRRRASRASARGTRDSSPSAPERSRCQVQPPRRPDGKSALASATRVRASRGRGHLPHTKARSSFPSARTGPPLGDRPKLRKKTPRSDLAAAVETALEAADGPVEDSAVSVQPSTLETVALPGSEMDYRGEEEDPPEPGESRGRTDFSSSPGSKTEEPAEAEPAQAEARFEPGPESSLPQKTEAVMTQTEAARVGRPLRLGTAKVRLLQELARADTANWKSLTRALEEAEGSGREKAELVDDLGRLADQRRQAAAATSEALQAEVEGSANSRKRTEPTCRLSKNKAWTWCAWRSTTLCALRSSPAASSPSDSPLKLRQEPGSGWRVGGRRPDGARNSTGPGGGGPGGPGLTAGRGQSQGACSEARDRGVPSPACGSGRRCRAVLSASTRLQAP